MSGSSGSCLARELFARKGEAVPSGAGNPRGSALTMFSGASPLSFLIQRRQVPAEEPAAGGGDQTPLPTTGAAPSWACVDGEDYPTRPVVGVETAAAEAAAPIDWKRVSFRLEADQYRRLRNLAGLWGVSGQSLIHKAVSQFLDGTVVANDGSWHN